MNLDIKYADKAYKDKRIIKIADEEIGGEKFQIIAGPCALESYDDFLREVRFLKSKGIKFIRAGAFKPRTSPYSFQGLGLEALEYFREIRKEEGVYIVSEITDLRDIDIFMESVDIVQVGARNMQNFPLLKELSHVKKPVLLKRGFANNVKELMYAAEYLLSGVNEDVIVCERGIRTLETVTRNTLDISMVPIIKQNSNLPVIVDPSHASGIRELVIPLSKAAAAVGADGVMVEVHESPDKAKSDGDESLTFDMVDNLIKETENIVKAVGRYV